MKLYRWAATGAEPGLEHLELRALPEGGWGADGAVLGAREGEPYSMRYQLLLDEQWRVRRASFDLMNGAVGVLVADGAGNWQDGEGNTLPQLEGCIDLDIAATPFSKTMPIRRLDLLQGERREIKVVYVHIEGVKLQVYPVAQAYTCVKTRNIYRYEGLFRNFTTELTVDKDAIVLQYPTLFKRVEAVVTTPGGKKTPSTVPWKSRGAKF